LPEALPDACPGDWPDAWPDAWPGACPDDWADALPAGFAPADVRAGRSAGLACRRKFCTFPMDAPSKIVTDPSVIYETLPASARGQ